jgi:membrane protease YdiL (CAAX protease family)
VAAGAALTRAGACRRESRAAAALAGRHRGDGGMLHAAARVALVVATAALVVEVLARRVPGRFPLADFLRDRFTPLPAGSRQRAVPAGAALAGAALAILPLAALAVRGWVVFEPAALAWGALAPAAATFALKIVFAALEESVFRGALLPLVARRAGLPAAIAASALVFALAHPPQSGVPALGTGLALVVRALDGLMYGVLFAATGTLWAAAAAHAAKNSCVWLVTGTSALQLTGGLWRARFTGPPLWTGGERGSGLVEVLVAAGVLAVVAAIAGRRRARRPAGSVPQPVLRQKALR